MAERNRRRFVVVWSGTASVVLGVTAVTGLSMAGSGRTHPAETAGTEATPRSAARPAASATAGAARGNAGTSGTAPNGRAAGGTAKPSTGSDMAPQAITFLRTKDPEERVARHVERIVQSGDYLRVYTDLPEDGENSEPAISLCEWTTEYLRGLRGAKVPIVFVHAKTSDNGNVVLANKQDDEDDCQVG